MKKTLGFRLLALGIVLSNCQPLPAQEAGVESKVIPAGNLPVSVRPGLYGDSGVAAADLATSITNAYTVTAPTAGPLRTFNPNNEELIIPCTPIGVGSSIDYTTTSEVSSSLLCRRFNAINDAQFYFVPHNAYKYEITVHMLTNGLTAADGANIYLSESSLNPTSYVAVIKNTSNVKSSTNNTFVLTLLSDTNQAGNISKELRINASNPSGVVTNFSSFYVYDVTAFVSNNTANVLATRLGDTQSANP